MTRPALLLLAGALVWALPNQAMTAQATTADQARILALIDGRFGATSEALVVGPVAVVDGYAVAGWTDRDRGGRALLRRDKGGWTLVLCAGDALTAAGELSGLGLPADQAARLAAAVRQAEQGEDPARIALFAGFDGIMRMEGGDPEP